MAFRHTLQVNLLWFAGLGKDDLFESVKDMKIVCDPSYFDITRSAEAESRSYRYIPATRAGIFLELTRTP